MLCQKCGLKEAVVHVVCVVNDKQIDKWLCSDCVEELAPSNFLSGTVFNAKEFLDGLLKPKAREEQIMNRFTERAKGILEDAMRFALDKGHDHVGTEHILLALLNVENCFAKKILEKLGIDNQAVIKELESWMEPAGSTELMISYTPRAKRALELAGEAAAAFKLHYVGSEHLLLGLLREGEGVAAQVLRRFNVTAEQVMKVIKAVYDNQPLTDGVIDADSSVHAQSWPKAEAEAMKVDNVEIVLQVNGKVKGRLVVPAEAGREELEKLALADEHIAAMVDVGKIVKIVCVPGRLVNIVARP